MFNFKIGAFAAGFAFILSLVIGFLSGVGVLLVLFRALIFAILFFIVSGLIFWLLNQFMPELLSGSKPEDDFSSPGSRVDINVEDSPVSGAFPADNSESVDDIAHTPEAPARDAPLDQTENPEYNQSWVRPEKAADSSESGSVENSDEDEEAGSGEVLPDMDKLEGTPVAVETKIDADTSSLDDLEPRVTLSSGKKIDTGDFAPKDLAQAIRTVLKRDEKG